MSRSRNATLALAALLPILALSGASRVLAQTPPARNWHDVKCARYRTAWAGALARFGTQGLGAAFLDRHRAFLASNCTAPADVCPRSAEELKLANVMVVLSMNAGTASTFPPFACPRAQ